MEYTIDDLAQDLYLNAAYLEGRLALPDNLQWFTNLWESGANAEQWYPFVKDFSHGMTFRQWDHIWQWCTILAEDIEDAKREFVSGILGWY